MVIFKFEKTSTSALAAHVDTLRAMTYIFRRAQIPVEYSNGFNPHIELGFSPPIALGVESLCEYVSAKADFSSDMLDRLNAACPPGLHFVKVFDKSANLAAVITRASYRIEAQGIGNVVQEVTSPNYSISYMERGTEVTKDVSAKIFAARRLDDNTAVVTLALGNNNLRPDRLAAHLIKKHGLAGDYRITKVQSFVEQTETDTYLENLEKKS